MALTYDKATYDAQYSVRAWEHGVRNVTRVPRHHYQWFVQRARIQNVVNGLTSLPGFAQVSHVALIGGGFGWTAEVLEGLGITTVCVDPSPYVINNLNVSEEAEIRQYLVDDGFDPDSVDFLVDPATGNTLTNAEAWAAWLRPDGVRTSANVVDEDLSNNGSRNRVRTSLSNQLDAIVTEWVLDSHTTDTEIETFLQNVDDLRPNPAVNPLHIIDPNPAEPVMITKTLAEWRIYLDARGFNDHWIVDSPSLVQGTLG